MGISRYPYTNYAVDVHYFPQLHESEVREAVRTDAVTGHYFLDMHYFQLVSIVRYFLRLTSSVQFSSVP